MCGVVKVIEQEFVKTLITLLEVQQTQITSHYAGYLRWVEQKYI